MEELRSGKLLRCRCGARLEKIDGCNYVKCPICSVEWCWQCRRVKYAECNEKEHNSH